MADEASKSGCDVFSFNNISNDSFNNILSSGNKATADLYLDPVGDRREQKNTEYQVNFEGTANGMTCSERHFFSFFLNSTVQYSSSTAYHFFELWFFQIVQNSVQFSKETEYTVFNSKILQSY